MSTTPVLDPAGPDEGNDPLEILPAADDLQLLHSSSVAVVGLGYVGLSAALAFINSGLPVLGLDISATRLAAIRSCDVDLLPSELPQLIFALQDPTFALACDLSLLRSVRAILICVPTPVDEHLVPDLSMLRAACDSVVRFASPGQTIILTSTSYVGSTEELLVAPLRARGFRVGHDIYVAFAPERVDPGNPAHNPNNVPRVLGGFTPQCADHARAILQHTTSNIHTVATPAIAEMTKLLENTFRAANIALINEIANYCYELDVNVRDVISAAATKPYGFMPFWPGPGVGGHCIPCDPHYLAWQLRTRRVQTPLLDAVMTAIANRPGHVVRRVVEALAERGVPLRCARILIYGVSYKPNVSDVRESPALQIITQLLSKVSTVAYFDPRVPALRAGMTTLSSLTTPAGVWDLVLLHTLHDDDSLSWLCTQQCVLDATYRLPASDSVITL